MTDLAHGHEHDHIDVSPATWTDPKRYAWLLGLLVPLLPFMAWGLVALTGFGVFWFWGPIFIFGVMPFLDTAIGKDSSNPPDSVVKYLEQDRYYRWCTYAFIPLQFVALVGGAALLAGDDLGLIEKLGLALTLGCVNGIGINTAHELGHKRASLERWLSKVALAPTGYGHFYIEHNRGHHVRVATPEDPASSRMGESFYRFWPRTVAGSLRSSFELEAQRLERDDIKWYSPRNDILNAWAMTVVLFAALLLVFGVDLLPWLVIQGVVGFSLLEVVNYLEHYGLLREKRDDGTDRYERTEPRHSWNSDNVSSNVLLYHLQRHSDHHAHPTRRFQALRHFDEAPELPSGYATMILLAVIPPLWRRVMDPRVVAHYEGDLGRANLDARKRDALLRRYAPSS
ncbi:alkane 1-monooxygenase [Baekduia sp.]|jgi:alkane 1-monooxygenase|uniref:alkane 1-monooxygenase n=1 Tax=Baekduia sp. TaxID=2600305 RepID=UPI002E099B6E|nr:alkane 1-monooxygenase [Baekduia sp.]